jgi:DinB superfamily
MRPGITIPDATTQPAAYKAALLELLGEGDPIDVIADTTVRARAMCDAVPAEKLTLTPEPDEWSARDLVAHLFDVDIVYGFRWRLVLTEDNPTYPGYNEKLFTPLPRLDFWPMFGAWEGLRASNLALLRGTPRSLWQRTGVHSEQGPETFEEMVQKLAAHDVAHLDQLERTLEAVA